MTIKVNLESQELAVAVVKWSACSPLTLAIRFRIALKPIVFSLKFVFEKNKSKQKNRPGLAHFFKKKT